MQVFQTSKVHPPNKAQEGPEKLSQIPTPPTCFAHPAPFRGHHHQEGDVSEQRIVPWIPPTLYSIPTLLHVHQHLNNCLAGYRATGLPIYFSKYHKYFNRLLYHKLNTRKHCYWLQFVNTFWLAAQNHIWSEAVFILQWKGSQSMGRSLSEQEVATVIPQKLFIDSISLALFRNALAPCFSKW